MTKKTDHLQLKGFLVFQILHELRRRELCGDDLALIIGQKKGSKLTPGTIYPALKHLRKQKLVQQTVKGRKKLYELTPKGKAEYKYMEGQFKKMFRQVFGQ